MALNIFISGTKAKSSEVNNNFNKSLSFNILNKIRQTIDRADIDSTGQDDIFSEAYIDSNGQNNTVNTGATTSKYDAGNDTYTGTLTESGGAEGESIATTDDNDFSFSRSVTINSNCIITKLGFLTNGAGTTNIAVTIYKNGVVVASGSVGASGSGQHKEITFTNANYSDLLATGDTVSYSVSVSGGQVYTKNGYAGYSGTLFDLASGKIQCDYSGNEIEVKAATYDATETVIEHTIPTGTYPATVSKLIGKGLYSILESGTAIQHRLENATENSGWIADGTIGSFTAFTSEPTKYIVKLIPIGSPTVNAPSIKGSGMYCE